VKRASEEFPAIDPREAMRARSKLLLGGWYRAEVASAIGDLGTMTWTLADLAERVPDVPPSCVNKELTILLDCDFVLRNGRNDRGQYLYSTAGLNEYWALGQALIERAARPSGESKVLPLWPNKRRGPKV